MRLPDFIIIGSTKSGTTSLYRYLDEHPEVFLSDPKEPCFFDENMTWEKGIGWYSSLFSEAKGFQACGEASTNYTRWPQVTDVPQKMYNVVPKAKLIYIMRDPSSRAFSHYVHRWTKEVNPGKPFTEDFDTFAEKDPMCIDGSYYSKQLDQYLEFFPREQILLVVFEELVQNPEKVVGEVFSFLGISDNAPVGGSLPKENVSSEYRYQEAKKAFRQHLQKNQLVRISMKLLPAFLKSYIYEKFLSNSEKARMIQQGFTPIELTNQQAQTLAARFEKANQELSERYGVNTSLWK